MSSVLSGARKTVPDSHRRSIQWLLATHRDLMRWFTVEVDCNEMIKVLEANEEFGKIKVSERRIKELNIVLFNYLQT